MNGVAVRVLINCIKSRLELAPKFKKRECLLFFHAALNRDKCGCNYCKLKRYKKDSCSLLNGKTKDVSQLRVEIHPIDPDEEIEKQTPIVLPLPGDPISSVDLSLSSFLSGSDCIQGDSGWWKYEFCYGKSVIQYHIERDGSKTVINLGNFVKSAHLEWLQNNPHKMPEPVAVRRHVSHFYTGGTICGKTRKPRHTEVKLKCMDINSGHGSVSLYLLEPKVCQYILVVESKIICQLLKKVDDHGLYEPVEEIGFSRAAYKNDYQPYNKVRDQDEKMGIHKEQEEVDRKEKNNKIPEMVNEDVALDNHIPDGDD